MDLSKHNLSFNSLLVEWSYTITSLTSKTI